MYNYFLEDNNLDSISSILIVGFLLVESFPDISFSDLEDSCQYRVAEKMGCPYLVTFNVKDYPVESDSSVKVLTPQQFLELHTDH